MEVRRLSDAFRQLDQLPVPPEADWFPAGRSGSGRARSVAFILAVVLAVIATVVVLRAVREPSSLVPAATPAPSPAATAAIGHTVTVTVYETIARTRHTLAGVPLNVWVDSNGNGYSLTYALGGQSLLTDANGHFTARDLGDVFLVVYAAKAGYVQPRAATVALRADATVDIELVPVDAVSVPALASPTDHPTVTGRVTENTPSGPRPVSGVKVWLEWTSDLPTATTVTDADGRYWLGQIPSGFVGVTTERAGYAATSQGVQVRGADVVLDLEVTRSP